VRIDNELLAKNAAMAEAIIEHAVAQRVRKRPSPGASLHPLPDGRMRGPCLVGVR
jgi:hypothetical protein